MKLKDFIAKHPPKKPGSPCKVCALPRKLLAEVNAALAIGDQKQVVSDWLRFDKKHHVTRHSVSRHAHRCLKIRGNHGTA